MAFKGGFGCDLISIRAFVFLFVFFVGSVCFQAKCYVWFILVLGFWLYMVCSYWFLGVLFVWFFVVVVEGCLWRK